MLDLLLLLLLLLLARVGVARVPTLAPDRGHVLPITADRLAALAACRTCLIAAELMRIAGGMRRTSAFGSDRALLGLVHRGEAPVGAVILLSHGKYPSAWAAPWSATAPMLGQCVLSRGRHPRRGLHPACARG